MFLIDAINKIFTNSVVFTWDALLVVVNFVTPDLKEGQVVPKGHPGAGGKWPEYIAPKEGDSRGPCPAINAMANHGIISRDGKNISFKEMSSALRTTYNISSTFGFFVPNYSANMLKKSYSKDTFDLADLSLHNGIEHDASLTREDTYHKSDQGKPHVPFVKELLGSASGKDPNGDPLLTVADLSRYSAKRRVEARATNPEFSLSTLHKMFGSGNSTTLVAIFGGRTKDLDTVLIDERLPEGWEPRVRSRMGYTLGAFNRTLLKVELGTDESKVPGQSSPRSSHTSSEGI